MNKNLKVSTIITTFRRADMLKRAIDSVLNQTYSNIEVIVVDDNDEKSDQNGGLTLNQARENYKRFGAVQESLRKYCRKPNKQEKLLNKPNESKEDK